MATETYFLPGYGIVVDEGDGDEYFLPGYGVVANNEAAAAGANPKGPLGMPFHGPFGGPIG